MEMQDELSDGLWSNKGDLDSQSQGGEGLPLPETWEVGSLLSTNQIPRTLATALELHLGPKQD